MHCRISQRRTAFLRAGCRSRIAQLEYKGETLHIKILKRKPLINTFYCIRHRLPIEQLIKLEKVRTENLKFRTDL